MPDKLTAQLQAMRTNFTEKKYDETIAAAQEILRLDSQNKEAKRYIKAAEAAKAKAKRAEEKAAAQKKRDKDRYLLGKIIAAPFEAIAQVLP